MPTPDINRILRENPRPCRYGAPMGARSFHDAAGALYLQRLRLVDGDYGADGTYWGYNREESMWCAFNGAELEHAPGMGSRIYVRASTREDAAKAVLEQFPDVTLHRT